MSFPNNDVYFLASSTVQIPGQIYHTSLLDKVFVKQKCACVCILNFYDYCFMYINCHLVVLYLNIYAKHMHLVIRTYQCIVFCTFYIVRILLYLQ